MSPRWVDEVKFEVAVGIERERLKAAIRECRTKQETERRTA